MSFFRHIDRIAILFEKQSFKRLRDIDVQLCNGFFVVERGLLDTSLPRDALSLAEFKCYLLHCRRVGGFKKTSNSSSNDLLRNGGIKKPKIREAAIEGLKEKYFIRELPPEDSGKRIFEMIGLPLYNAATGQYHPSPYERKIHKMKQDNNGYVQVPNEIVDTGVLRDLSEVEIKVLLKLFEHTRTEIYGGVDPNRISFIISGEALALESLMTEELILGKQYAVVDRCMYEDLYLTRKTFIKGLRRLSLRGLIRIERRRASVTEEGRIIIRPDHADGDIIHMLRPIHQLHWQFKLWEERFGG